MPQRVDGVESKSKIKNSAIQLFSTRSFSDVSVSQITKLANLSTGAFYQYYINKDELFREITEEFFTELETNLRGDTLKDVGLKFLNFSFERSDFVKIVHLNEYSFEWLRNEYENILRKVSREFGLTHVGHFYFWSPLKFIVAFFDLLEVDIDYEHFITLILDGAIAQCEEKIPESVFDFTPLRHVLEDDEKREQILASAESLFGLYGYEKTLVYDIAKASGIAVGTFYLYFKNKIQVLRELVRWISKGLRYNVKLAVEKFSSHNRIIQEIAGLYAFLKFFKVHSNMYKIVRESQSVDRNIAKEYYNSIYEPYINSLKKAVAQGQLVLKKTYSAEEEISYIVLLLMSFGHYAGEKYLLTGHINGEKDEQIQSFLFELYEYICRGLEVSR
ncbi:MAG: TetR/AcrR family transcriptional regulator [Fervidobacterium sp.]|nr:TetR/AcrR family transcriptional regulator [Fervidobacterium sp.]